MLALPGCVQPALAPQINAAAARVLDLHLNDQAAGRADIRALIDAWWPQVAAGGVEAIVMTASGCGAFVKEYGHHLKEDPLYREKAERIASLTKDLSEILPEEKIPRTAKPRRVAFQSPCTLQHGQQIRGKVEALLRRAGYELTDVPEAHLCCGSAGTYSILQPELSAQLRERKLGALLSGSPDVIATANIGCLAHLQGESRVPVKHWIELLE
jgi:glycolate oxidase iron-sulfur subunit